MENKLREDLWKAIQAHYERSDFTESVRDAVLYTCEVLREKSGISDKDGTKLVDAALMGNNPAITINKNETTTEKDVQQGIGFAFKGIMQSVRNPLSHEKFTYTQDEAESIILYINFLLNRIDHSGGKTKIENIMELLFDDDFTDTEEYADLLLKEVPVKKRYDLLLNIYTNREHLPCDQLRYFIPALYNSLTKAAKSDFCHVVSTSLMQCKDDKNLRMYCHYFMDITYQEIDKLAQLRMEDLFFKSIKNGKMDWDGSDGELHCNKQGSLSIWINDKLNLFSNHTTIIDTLFRKLNGSENEQAFVFEYFSKEFEKPASEFNESEINLIKRELKKGNKLFCDWLEWPIEIDIDSEMVDLFGSEYAECKKTIEEREKMCEFPF